MKFIAYNGETLALCLAAPDWSDDVNVEITIPTDITRANSAQESRRRFGRSARYSLEYTVFTGDHAESTALRLWLQRLKGETVAVPMWTDAVELSADVAIGSVALSKTSDNPVRYGAEWIVLSPDLTTYEIVVVTAVTDSTVTLASPGITLAWTNGTLMFPLLFGSIPERPSFDSETDELLNGRIKFQENSPYARRLNLFAGTIPLVGSGIPELSTKPLWDIQPDESTKSVDSSQSDILRKSFGFLREDQVYAQPQPNRRTLQLHVSTGDRTEIAKVERLFTDRGATTKTLAVPTFRGDMRYAVYDELVYGPLPQGIAIEPG